MRRMATLNSTVHELKVRMKLRERLRPLFGVVDTLALPGTALSALYLRALRRLSGLDYEGIERSIDSRVSRLRRKLGDDVSAAGHIKTVRPHGYLFSPNPW